MKTKILLIAVLLLRVIFSDAQVVIRNLSKPAFGDSGFFKSSAQYYEIKLNQTQKALSVSKTKNKPKSAILQTEHKFDTSISLNKITKWVTVGSFSVIRMKISVPNSPSIRLLFKNLILPEGAEMYVYNQDRTTVLGPITQKDKNHEGRLWGTNIFSGSGLFIEVKAPSILVNSVKIDIQNILFGFSQVERNSINKNKSDSLQTAYFNQSSSCNVNILCSAGNGYDVQRRGVALILLPDGSCSGFMVNDACNSRTPYLMTAYHATNGRNPGDWQYIFQYWSPQCSPNQDGTYSLLFNGASLVSTWIQTDFSLLQLYDTPPINSGITYLGWSRSSTAPGSSVGIHHPMGDVMKVSIENNSATIGNVQGYSNTGWRVLYDVGAIEAGSSGSPLFDPNQLVVGQLYSNTQPNSPCNTQSGGTNYGRFDISWDGGGTSGTRLKDYLDPGNTSPSSVPNFDPTSDLAMSGVSSFCSGSQTYSMSGLPSGMTVTSWSISPSTGVVSMTSSGNSATLSYAGDGVVTLTATIATLCSGSINVQKTIGVGGPAVSFYIAPLWYTNDHQYCTNSFSNNFQIIASSLPNVTAFEWGISPSTVINANGWTEERGVIFTIGGNYQIYARAKNSCGYGYTNTATLDIYVNDNCIGGLATINKNLITTFTEENSEYIRLFPNPAKNILRMIIPGKIVPRKSTIKVFDISGRELVNAINPTSQEIKIDISKFPAGAYFIQLFDEKNRYTKKFIKQ